MATTRTYYISDDSAICRRLDNFTLPWITLTLPGNNGNVDIKADPTDPDHVFVASRPDIYVSTNAGFFWNIAGGNYNTSGVINWNEIWPIDANNIVACGDGGRVAVSTDGGLTFNLTTSCTTPTGNPIPGTAGLAIHFLTPLIGVVGYQDFVYKTTDGGASWAIVNSGNPIAPPGQFDLINAIHISEDEQTVVANGQRFIMRSTDAGATFSLVYTWPQNQGTHMTWLDDNTLWAVGNFSTRISSIDAGATWVTIAPSQSPAGLVSRAAHFYSTPNGYFSLQQSVYETFDSGVTGALSDPGGTTVTAIWTQLAVETCYLLTDCFDQTITITINGDLSTYLGLTVQIPIFGSNCWIVSIAPDCINAIPYPPVGPPPIVNVFVDCASCAPSTCYELTDCSGVETSVITSTDLSALVGFVINGLDVTNASPASSYPDPTCWLVSLYGPCDVDNPVTYSYSYPDCECCLAQSPPSPPPIDRVIPDPVKIFYRIPESACDIRANEMFAEGYWKLVKKLRFGVSDCCKGIDLEGLWVKKQLSDLDGMLDPNFCTVTATPCSPCAPVNHCHPCITSYTPCSAPDQPYPGKLCYTKICFEDFIPCLISTGNNTFSFDMSGTLISTGITITCLDTMSTIQAALDLSIVDPTTTRLIVTTFDTDGLCFYMEQTFTTDEAQTIGTIVRDDGVTPETITGDIICDLLPPACDAPIT